MFTGIVEATGKVEALRAKGKGSWRVSITTALPIARLPLGASIAVSGVCLTIVARRAGGFAADLGPETLARTTLGSLRAGDRVHLERPLRLGDPLGGHLVSGHVDGVGRIGTRRPHGDALELRVRAPRSLLMFLAPKGSVTIDGVSLTVNRVDRTGFSVMLIPHTLAVTCLGERRSGDRVNIEVDLIAKHVAQFLKKHVR